MASLVYVLEKRCGRETGCDSMLIVVNVGRGTYEMGLMVGGGNLYDRGRLEIGRLEEI